MAGAFLEKKQLGVWSLSFMGLTAMLGSGWLLASYYVYHAAGSYAPIAWCIGFVMILIIAMSFAETCSMVDRDGATVILPRLSHGYFLSAIFGFFGLVSWVALVPIEVAATLQYLTYFIHGIYVRPGVMTPFGYGLGIALVLCIALINTFSMLWIKKLNNNLFTPLKIGIPIIVIIASIYHTHGSVTAPIVHQNFGIKGIFLALPVGVVFSFNGFKSICVIAGRAVNPQKTITRALLISLVVCLVLYLGLQYAFNLNATAQVIADSHSPYASILGHTVWMLVLLYIGAVSSPFTANIFNLNAANACCYRMSLMHYLPKVFSKTNRYHQYVVASFFNMIIGILLVLNSQRWDTMVQNLTCIMIITYTAAPIAQAVFRKNLKEINRPVKFKGGVWIGYTGFILSNIMIFWSGYAAIKLACILLIIVSIWVVLYAKLSRQQESLSFARALWVFLWLGGLLLIAHFSTFGGIGVLSHLAAIACLVVFSAIMIALFSLSALPHDQAIKTLRDIEQDTVSVV